MNTTPKSGMDFWNDHSLEFLEMAMKRDFQENVAVCDGKGMARRECGDTVSFFLSEDEGRLTSISYDIQGCLFTHACANTIIKLALDRTVAEARRIEKNDIIVYLKTLPRNEEHCAVLALKAFGRALADLKSA